MKANLSSCQKLGGYQIKKRDNNGAPIMHRCCIELIQL